MAKSFRGSARWGLSAVFVLAVTSAARADVTALGDVAPTKSIDVNGTPTVVPDLPQFGGMVPGTITVGGTTLQVGGTDTGQLIIDVPSDTDPLVSQMGVIGGPAIA